VAKGSSVAEYGELTKGRDRNGQNDTVGVDRGVRALEDDCIVAIGVAANIGDNCVQKDLNPTTTASAHVFEEMDKDRCESLFDDEVVRAAGHFASGYKGAEGDIGAHALRLCTIGEPVQKAGCSGRAEESVGEFAEGVCSECGGRKAGDLGYNGRPGRVEVIRQRGGIAVMFPGQIGGKRDACEAEAVDKFADEAVIRVDATGTDFVLFAILATCVDTPPDVVVALNQGNTIARGCQFIGEPEASDTGADNDRVP
jgi:hypothetical protein